MKKKHQFYNVEIIRRGGRLAWRGRSPCRKYCPENNLRNSGRTGPAVHEAEAREVRAQGLRKTKTMKRDVEKQQEKSWYEK